MKVKDQNTSDPYTKIALRAKLCLEAEQRRRIGGWINRVLVIDKATLFTYRLRGDRGSVNAWEIGGAEVGARKPRKDGRYVVAVARQDAYSLLFALNTLDEQAAFIHALSSSGSTVVGIYGVLLLKEYTEIQKAIKMSREIQETYGYQNLVYGKNSQNSTSPKRALEIPELSSRMTEVTWTFNSPSNCSQKTESGRDKIMLNDILHSPISDIPRKLNAKNSSYSERKQEYRYSFPCNSTLSMAIPYKKPLARNLAIDTLKINNPLLNETPSNNSGLKLNSEDIYFMSDESGKVSKIRQMFESRQMKEISETSRTHLKNQKHDKETLRRFGSVDCIDSKFKSKEPEKKWDGNQLHAKSKSMEGSRYGIEFPETGVTKWTIESNNLRKKLDQRNINSSLVRDNNSEVILSAILKVTQSASGKCQPTKVELIRGHLVLMTKVQPSTERRGENYRLGNSLEADSQSVVRLELEGVSTIPLNQENRSILILKRKSKILVIIQIDPPDELMTWVRAISDEIMAVTPLPQRNSLIIYPGPLFNGRQFPFEISAKEKMPWLTKGKNSGWKSEESVEDLSSISDDSKEAENQTKPENVFKGLRRTFGIRRQSRDIEKTTLENHSDQYFHLLPERNEDAYNDKVQNAEIRINVPVKKSEFRIEKSNYTSNVKFIISRHPSEFLRENGGLEYGATNCFIPDTTRKDAIISPTNTTSGTENDQLKRGKNLTENEETLATEGHRNITEWPFKFGNSLKISERFVQDAIQRFDGIASGSSPQLIKQSPKHEKYSSKDAEKQTWEKESQPILKVNRKAEKHTSFLSAKQLFVGIRTTNTTEDARMNESAEDAVERESIGSHPSENGTENKDDANINVNWSVATLKERFEILNTVNKDKDSSYKASWSRNSIRKRKEMRNSIRRKKTLEGETRRASIKRNTKKDHGVVDLKKEENHHQQITNNKVLNQQNVDKGSSEKLIHDNSLKSFELSGSNFSSTSESKQLKQRIPLITITTDDEGKWKKGINLNQHMIPDKSYIAMDPSNLMRSHSLNSPRSIIISKDRKFKASQQTSFLRSESSVKLAKRRTNSLRNELPNDTNIVTKSDSEGSIYEYLNDTFLAKRCLVAKEVEVSRIQDALLRQEEQICEIQLKLNSLSIPKLSQNHPRRGINEYQIWRKLEKELVTARTQYDILEDRLNEAKHKTTTIKQDMQTTIRKCLQSEQHF